MTEHEDSEAKTAELARKVRAYGVDPEALLNEGLELAKIQDALRRRERVYLPAVALEDADPVGLLATVRDMVEQDQRPALALAVALAGSTARGLASNSPAVLADPEIMVWLLELCSVAQRPHPPTFVRAADELLGREVPVPVIDQRLRELPAEDEPFVEQLAQQFLADCGSPREKHDKFVTNQVRAACPNAPSESADDVPLGTDLKLPPPRVPDDEAKRLLDAAEARAVVIAKHAALRAFRLYAEALARWTPGEEVSKAAVNLLSEDLPKVRQRAGVAIRREVANGFGVDERTIRRALRKEP